MKIYSSNNLRALLGLSLTASMLSACSGGGDEAVQYDYTQGTPSSEASADNYIASAVGFSLPYENGGRTYTSLQNANNVLNGGGDMAATTDTNARTAWRAGWTGKGVKIGIADDFNSNGRLDTHGDMVSIIAGSVAPEATYALRDMIGASRSMTADQALNYFEDNGYHIINASWGIERGGVSDSVFEQRVNSALNNFNQATEDGKQALIVYAAGNSGYTCSGKRSENCSLQQAIVSRLRTSGNTAGENTIFVGSLADSSNSMAGYSVTAGDLKYDFIVAHDDIVTSGDGAGTSYAAPRVAGAAAVVRQKFPNLTSSQLKQVILQTADDLGVAGVDETYGYGKLNVLNALSPIGTVVPK
jgi:subtilisin family serine protease